MEDVQNVRIPFNNGQLLNLKSQHEYVREERFLEEVFANTRANKLENEKWLKSVAKSDWVFNAKELREIVFTSAGLQIAKA